MKQKVKILVDIAMYLLFVYLMGYHAGSGLWLHGVTGCILFVLFALHHGLNLAWYQGIAKGTYTFVRVLYVVTNLLLLLDMVLMAVSSVVMAGEVFAFVPFHATQTVRTLHLVSASWGFVLIAFHLGLHTHKWFEKLYQKIMESFFGYSYILLFFLIFFAGIYCFITAGLWQVMFLFTDRGFRVYGMGFYVKYGMVSLAACQAVHLLLHFSIGMSQKRFH